MAPRSKINGPGGTPIPCYVTITNAASATTDGMESTFTVKNANGDTVEAVTCLEVWISEATTGIGLTADSYSGSSSAVSTYGAIHTALTAKKHFMVVTNASGVFRLLSIASANPTDQYVCCKNPLGGGVTVSAASGTSWEGV
jgi:hypothetical protein